MGLLCTLYSFGQGLGEQILNFKALLLCFWHWAGSVDLATD